VLAALGRRTLSPDEVPGIDVIPQERIHEVLSALLKAWSKYWPQQPFDGQIVMVSSTVPIDWVGAIFDDPCKGWSRWTTKPVKLYELNTPHTEFFRDAYIEEVACQMREVLEAAKAEEPRLQGRNAPKVNIAPFILETKQS
jgi:hypothetical protein